MTMMAESKPARSASIRAWWITGHSPSSSNSLGMARVSGRKRVPSPAAGMTTRISSLLRSRGHQRAEVRVLFGPQPVAEAALGDVDVLVTDHAIFRDVASEPARSEEH